MVEFHSLWSLPMAKKLAERLAEFDTYWHEDPFRLDNVGDLAEYAPHSKAWVCASETLAYTHSLPRVPGDRRGGRRHARPVLVRRPHRSAQDRRHGARPGTRRSRRTTAPGRSSTLRRAIFSLHARNALIQESVRAFYTGWYRELVTELPVIADGHVSISDRPGLGLELLPGIEERHDATVRTYRLAGG